MNKTGHIVLRSIPTGPRKSTPEIRAALRKASIGFVRDRLAEHSRISAKTWVVIGDELRGTKEDACKDGTKIFASMFAPTAKARSDQTRYPFALGTGYRLIAIAETFTQWVKTDSLPSSWHTLYVLTHIPVARLHQLIDAGTVHPMMTRAEASKLAGATKRNKPKVAINGPPRESYLCFLKELPTRKRANELARLVHDSGCTLDQLKKEMKE